MMLIESLPVEIYMEYAFERVEIKASLENIRVDDFEIKKLLVNHFKGMGLFSVEPAMAPILLKKIIDYVKTSPDIMKLERAVRLREMRIKRVKGSKDY